MTRTSWPPLPYPEWADSCTALHLWSQILGKYRLAHTPWVKHSWHATLYVTPRGLTTGPVHEPGGCLTLTLDFVDHRLIAEADGGARERARTGRRTQRVWSWIVCRSIMMFAEEHAAAGQGSAAVSVSGDGKRPIHTAPRPEIVATGAFRG